MKADDWPVVEMHSIICATKKGWTLQKHQQQTRLNNV